MLPSTLKEKLQCYFFDGAWSLGIAASITGGILTPLTLIISGGIFTIQAASGFPITKVLSNIRDHFDDSDYIPSDHESDDDDLDAEYEAEFNQPIKEGIRAELFENTVTSYLPAQGIRKIPGMNWLLGEQTVRYTLPRLDTGEIANIPYGSTRSGRTFRHD